MDSIVAEIIKIIKDADDNISREEALKLYFEDLLCRCVSEALEQIDVERLDYKISHYDEMLKCSEKLKS